MSYDPIEKNIEPSLNKVLELMNSASLTMKLDGHYLNNNLFEIAKGNRQYDFSSTSTILKGPQTHKEIQFERQDKVELSKSNMSLFTLGKNILVNHISYSDDLERKIFGGSISSFSTTPELNSFDNQFLRCIIPVGTAKAFDIHQFERRYFTTPQKKSPYFLACPVSEHEFHLFNYRLGEDHYLILDCLQQTDLNTFQKKNFNLLLTLGLIIGNLIYDECFILSFPNQAMEQPNHVLYDSMRASIYSGQGIFTNNPFSVYYDIDFERDEEGRITEKERGRLYEGIFDFPAEVFSKLTALFYEEEKLQRAALIFIQSHITSLEIRIPNYYVAIEAITGYISSKLGSNNKPLSPIKDKSIADNLIFQIKDIVKKMKSENCLDDDAFNWEILEKNINKLNAPPNADKLSKSFEYIGYGLSLEQKKVLKERNRFLHGSFLKTTTDDKRFNEALHVGLRLHFMIAVLILKLGGYSGKIINYAELWSHITEQDLGEERLVSI